MKRMMLLLLGALFSFSAIIAEEECNKVVTLLGPVSLGEFCRQKNVEPGLVAELNKMSLNWENTDSIFLEKGRSIIIPTSAQSRAYLAGDTSRTTFSPIICLKKDSVKNSMKSIKLKKEIPIPIDGNFLSGFIGAGKGMPYNREDYVANRFYADEGDKLIKPAKVYKVSLRLLRAFNGLSSLTLSLNGGEEILIPDKDFTYWITFNGNPVGNIKQEKLFRLFKEKMAWGKNYLILAELRKIMESGEYEAGIISSGQYLNQMFSGGGICGKDVIAAWKNKESAAARLYKIPLGKISPKWEGLILVVADPDVCHNWCWWIEDEPVPVILKEPEPAPPIETPTPVDTPETVIVPPIEFVKVVYGGWDKMPRWVFYLGHDVPEDTATKEPVFRRHGASCAGAIWECFFRKKSWQTRNSFGITGELNLWDGESFLSRFIYDGFNVAGGPAVIWSPFQIAYLSLDGGIGHQWSWGRLNGIDYRYRSFQTSLFWKIGSTFDLVPPFWNLSFWGNYQKSLPKYTKKESYVNGVQNTLGSDPPNVIAGWSYGMNLYLFAEKPVNPLLAWVESFDKDSKALRMFLGVGIRCCNKQLIIEAGYTHCENSKWDSDRANGYRAQAVWIGGYGRQRPKPVEVQSEQAVIQPKKEEVW